MYSSLSGLAAYDQLIGGMAGGVASTLVCHPLDLLKTRFSANDKNPLRPQYSGYINATRRIIQAEGYRGLYQGLTPNLLGCAVSWALYFHWYHKLKARKVLETPWENVDNFVCGVVSGTAIMSITNPVWVSKTRLLLQYESLTAKKYNGMLDCLLKITREEGIRGLYKSNMETTFCSIVSKVIATTSIFPYQVIRTRMQDHNVQSLGIWKTTQSTIGNEGWTALWKGCLMANIRLLPAAVVTFVTYENVRHSIKNLG